jgi:transcriptional regulator with XRE-family HTH domain
MSEKIDEKELNLVKKTCKELGITQKQLAEKIGVSRVTINDWANDKTPIPKWGKNIIFYINENYELLTFKKNLKKLIESDRNILLSL